MICGAAEAQNEVVSGGRADYHPRHKELNDVRVLQSIRAAGCPAWGALGLLVCGLGCGRPAEPQAQPPAPTAAVVGRPTPIADAPASAPARRLGSEAEIVTALQSPDPVLKMKAARLAARQSTPGSIADLLRAMAACPDARLRASMRSTLELANPESCAAALVATLSGPDPAGVAPVVRGLLPRRGGAAVARALADAAARPGLDARQVAQLAAILGELRNPAAVPGLATGLDAPTWAVFEKSAAALAAIGTESALQELLLRLERDDAGDEILVGAITSIKNPAALPLLLALARGDTANAAYTEREAAILALVNFPREKIAPVLQQLQARERDPDLREDIQTVLRNAR